MNDYEEQILFEELGGHPWLLTETLFYLWENYTLEESLNKVFESLQIHLEVWRSQLHEADIKLLYEIPESGFEIGEFGRNGKRRYQTSSLQVLRCLCLVELEGDRVYAGPKMILQSLRTPT